MNAFKWKEVIVPIERGRYVEEHDADVGIVRREEEGRGGRNQSGHEP